MEETNKEIWKDIPGYEGYFQVSSLGNFRSLDRIVKYKTSGTRKYPGKRLLVENMEDGYQRIVLMRDANRVRYMCHRLVALAFVPNPDNKPFVNHINGIRNDNRPENLEWCTQSENELHSTRILGKSMVGKTFPKKVLCVDTNTAFDSLSKVVEWLGEGCIEGINKAISANRAYHSHKFKFIN